MNTMIATKPADAEQKFAQEVSAPGLEAPLPDRVLWVNWELPNQMPSTEKERNVPEPPERESAADWPTKEKTSSGVSAEPKPVSWQDVERGTHWNRILTADPDTVPLDIRNAVGADMESMSPEEQEYHLLRTVNRSWAVDHLALSREKVSADWPGIRSALAEKLGVESNEREVFTALSLHAREEPLRQKARTVYEAEYLSALDGEPESNSAEKRNQPDFPGLENIRAMARCAAEEAREEVLQHSEALEQLLSSILQLERGPVAQAQVLWKSPSFLSALDELAELSDSKRATLYRVAQAEWKKNGQALQTESLPVAMLHNMIRSGVNLSLNLGQAVGNLGVAQLEQLGDSLGIESLSNFSSGLDKRLRVFEELRRVAQHEVLPIQLEEDASFAEELLVDVAGAVPDAAMAFSGVPGITLLAASSAGASVAEARQRAPETSQKLQTAAGCLAGAAQAAIFKGMSGLGQRLINRTINQFAGSLGKGVGSYVLSALKSGAWFTQETVNLLVAGKTAQLAEMGLQELASRADETASNINWSDYGDNLLDLETNIREAAVNLPFVLIAGGRAALHHFRSPRTVLGDGHRLDDWGVDPVMKERVMTAPTLQRQNELLREALRSSTRWSGAGFLSEIAAKSLRLLQNKHLHLFDNEQTVAQFLEHPGEQSVLKEMLRKRDEAKTSPHTEEPPSSQLLLPEHFISKKSIPAEKWNWLHQLMRGWLSAAGLPDGQSGADSSANLIAGISHLQIDGKNAIPPMLRQNGYYVPQAERVRRAMLAELVHTVEQVSHRFLLNTYTIDTLNRSFPTEKKAVEHTEKVRRQIHHVAAKAILQSVIDGHRADANSSIKNFFRDFYMNRHYNSIREPWLQKNTLAQIRKLTALADGSERLSSRHPAEIRELRLQYMGLSYAVRGMVELIPHMEDFHTLLSRGHSPLSAYAAILSREFGLEESSSAWKPADWSSGLSWPNESETRAATESNIDKMRLYTQLTGRTPEVVTKNSGGELWRILRPDGTYTRWHESSGHVANDMSYVYALRLGMPYEKDLYSERLQENMRVNGLAFARMLPQQRRRFNTHDALGCIALNDLHELWLGDASVRPLGLDYHSSELPGMSARREYDGVASFMIPGEKENTPQHYLLDPKRTVNPLNLIFAKAKVHWQRMLDSGAFLPSDMADFLEQQGEISHKRKLELLHLPEINHRLYRLPEVRKMSRKHRLRYVQQLQDLLQNRNTAEMREALASAMSYFSAKYLIADMDNVSIPSSVREWIAAAPFREPDSRTAADRPGRLVRSRSDSFNQKKSDSFLIRWMNDRAADFLRENAEHIATVRRNLQDEQSPLRQSPFLVHIRELWTPSEGQRKEQCWTHLLSDDRQFRHSGQELWNLLRLPSSAWNYLSVHEKEVLKNDLLPVVREYPAPGVDPDAADAVEQSLHHLQALLEEKPNLRDFALNPQNPGEILRLLLDEPPASHSAPSRGILHSKDSLQAPLPSLHSGGKIIRSELPENLAEDSRVMPALHLLMALRHQVMDYPVVTPQGIRWRNQNYGGQSGAQPNGLNHEWAAHRPLTGLLTALQKLETGMAGKQMEWAGEVLEPLHTEIDLNPLQHVTIYKRPLYPHVQLRLMPGDFASASEYRRKPYVVHSLAGAPLSRRRGWSLQGHVGEVYQDLVHFDSNLERGDYDERNHKAGGFFAMVFNQLQTRLMDKKLLRMGRDADLSNREIIMHLAQDTGYSDKLSGADINTFTPDDVLTLSLFRLLMAYEYGTHPETAENELLKLGARFRENSNLFEQVKENVLDSGELGLDLVEATRLADEHLIRREDGTAIQKRYLPPTKRSYQKIDRRHFITHPIDDDARAREYMRTPRKHEKNTTYDGLR